MNVLMFSQRKKMEDKFLHWAEKNKITVCPLNVITYLYSNDLINVDKFLEYLKEED